MLRLAPLLAVALAFSTGEAAALSNAAKYLIDEHAARACDGDVEVDLSAVFEGDLTGDGKSDLVLDHGAFTCRDTGLRSNECGAALCSVYFYVREGGLLVQKLEILSVGATVTAGSPPRIGLVDSEFKEHSVAWNGRDFE